MKMVTSFTVIILGGEVSTTDGCREIKLCIEDRSSNIDQELNLL